jgi:hypothetical protein
MARFTVKLAKDDPFAAASRTFYGIPGKITTEPVTLELTPEQAESLRGHGVLVKHERDTKGGDLGVEVTANREIDSYADSPARKGRT